MQPIIVKGRQVQVKTTPPGEVSTPAPVCGAEEPEVRLLREGDVVVAIEVRCACGRPTVVRLDYEQTPSVPTSPPDEPTSSGPTPTESTSSESTPTESTLTESTLSESTPSAEVE